MGAISRTDLYVIILLMSFNYVIADFDDGSRYYQEDDNRIYTEKLPTNIIW